ncbi:MAG: T9SS type A sorting domain-containing protein [Saprospiraceae bacterium]
MKTFSILFIWLTCSLCVELNAQQLHAISLTNHQAVLSAQERYLPENYDLTLMGLVDYQVPTLDDGRSSSIDQISEDVGPTIDVGVNEIAINQSSIMLYPTPIVSAFTISYQLDRPASIGIRLFNIQGQMIQELMSPQPESAGNQLHQFALNSNITPGMYFVQIADSKHAVYLKAMK